MDKYNNTGKQTKFIFVTGGVLSGVGKGTTAASIGAVLKAKGLVVSIQKCDPYLNVDAGLLDPREHGECFVTRDGAETDLDLGHYERFLDQELVQDNAVLSGRLLLQMIDDERSGKYSGKTIQYVPHFTKVIQSTFARASRGSDVHIVEIGGTVGDYEGLAYIEAIREFGRQIGVENALFVHVVYVPFIGTSKEFKSKPAQSALSDLRGFGIVPDAVIVRTESRAPVSVARKIAMFGGVPEANVILMPNLSSVFQIPDKIASSSLMDLLNSFTGSTNQPDLAVWQQLVGLQLSKKGHSVTIGIVTSYGDNEDVHLSLVEALCAAGWWGDAAVDFRYIDANDMTEDSLQEVDGIIVPDDGADNGIAGKLQAVGYALDRDVPLLCVGEGIQALALVAAQRGGANLPGKSFAEVTVQAPARQIGDVKLKLVDGSLVEGIYGGKAVTERHRNRVILNKEFVQSMTQSDVEVSGTSLGGEIIEFIESSGHKFAIGVQGRPEFRSRPMRPHPLISRFIAETASK